MEHPHNFIVVGDNEKDAAKYNTQLQPITLEENFGMAITSIHHGSIHNVTSNNQEVIYEVKMEVKMEVDVERLLIPGSVKYTKAIESFKMEEGNYGSTLAILKTIAAIFEEEFPSDEDFERNRGRQRGGGGGRNRPRKYREAGIMKEKTHSRSVRKIKPDKPLRLEIDDSSLDNNNEGFIYVTPKNMKLVVEQNTPWKIMGINFDIPENREIEIRMLLIQKQNNQRFCILISLKTPI